MHIILYTHITYTQYTDASHMKEILGWLRLGWLEIAPIIR